MTRNGKIIMALLLACFTLAGALHHFQSVAKVSAATEAPPSVPETKETPPPAEPASADQASTSAEELRRWVGKDPTAATDWAVRLPEGNERTEALTTICFELAQKDPYEAVMLADQNHLTNQATLPNLVQQWAQSDLTAARDWAVKKPDGEQKAGMLERIAYVWSAADPVGAAQFALQHIEPGDAQTETVISILHQWAESNWTAANDWVQQFPEGPIRDRAVKELAGIKDYQFSPPE